MALSYIDDLRSRSWVGFAEVAILAPELLIMRRRERSASSRIGIGRPNAKNADCDECNMVCCMYE